MYVLDARLTPAPIGVPGELYIGGVQLGRGYWRRAGLTAERFLPDPFSPGPGARLYRTGDLARWLPDGTLEYLGRIDHQIKLRGFRIELGEIEAALGQHDGVRETVVVAREDALGDKRLVAYFVARQDPTPSTTELRSFLQQRLPEHMVPAIFVPLDAMPLTPSGKVDRRSLPAAQVERTASGASFVAPRDRTELKLVQIWEDALQIRPVGVQDDFFAIGGHSLLAVRLMASIRALFGQALPLTTLFQQPTVESMAQRLRECAAPRAWSPLVEIQSHGDARPFFCVHPGGGTVLCYLELARGLGDRPFYGLQARGADREQPPNSRIEVMAAEYIEALRGVQPEGPYLLGGWSMGGFVAFEMAQQLLRDGQEVALLALIDSDVRLIGSGRKAWDDAQFLAAQASVLGIPVSYEDLRGRSLDEQVSLVLTAARSAGLVGVGFDTLDVKRLVEVCRVHDQALQDYTPRLYPGRLCVLRAVETGAPTGGEAAEVASPDPALGWRELSSQAIESCDIPGDHETLIKDPHVQVLAERLKERILMAEQSLSRRSGAAR
jgi:thioesterase domain-containing protein